MIGWTLMPATIPPTTYSIYKLRERSSQLFRSREGLLELLECKCKAIRMKTEEVTIKKGSKATAYISRIRLKAVPNHILRLYSARLKSPFRQSLIGGSELPLYAGNEKLYI
jgi:hypothetical protein